MLRAITVCSIVAASLAACGGDEGGNGVNDVRAACEIRQGWTQATAEACGTCKTSASIDPDCDCTPDEYRGLCSEQLVARNAEADCTGELQVCVGNCLDDCDCIDQCFVGHDTCKTRYAAYDGCIADVCAEPCQ